MAALADQIKEIFAANEDNMANAIVQVLTLVVGKILGFISAEEGYDA